MKALIIVADFYDDIADMLIEGAVAELDKENINHEICRVPGALEIPPVIARKSGYDAYIALGCVIRGETSHYDIVAIEPARALMDLAVTEKKAIGNGILTVENRNQAIVRADPKQKNKGRDAVNAALTLAKL